MTKPTPTERQLAIATAKREEVAEALGLQANASHGEMVDAARAREGSAEARALREHIQSLFKEIASLRAQLSSAQSRRAITTWSWLWRR